MVTGPTGPKGPAGPTVPAKPEPVAKTKVHRPPADIAPKAKGAGLGGIIGVILAGAVASLTELQKSRPSPLIGLALLLLPALGAFAGSYFTAGDGQ